MVEAFETVGLSLLVTTREVRSVALLAMLVQTMPLTMLLLLLTMLLLTMLLLTVTPPRAVDYVVRRCRR